MSKPISAGYYLIAGLSSQKVDENGYVFATGTINGTHLNGTTLTPTCAIYSTNDTNLVWRFLAVADVENGFYIQNVATGEYLYYANSGNAIYSGDASKATVWTVAKKADGVYTLSTAGRYLSAY